MQFRQGPANQFQAFIFSYKHQEAITQFKLCLKILWFEEKWNAQIMFWKDHSDDCRVKWLREGESDGKKATKCLMVNKQEMRQKIKKILNESHNKGWIQQMFKKNIITDLEDYWMWGNKNIGWLLDMLLSKCFHQLRYIGESIRILKLNMTFFFLIEVPMGHNMVSQIMIPPKIMCSKPQNIRNS